METKIIHLGPREARVKRPTAGGGIHTRLPLRHTPLVIAALSFSSRQVHAFRSLPRSYSLPLSPTKPCLYTSDILLSSLSGSFLQAVPMTLPNYHGVHSTTALWMLLRYFPVSAAAWNLRHPERKYTAARRRMMTMPKTVTHILTNTRAYLRTPCFSRLFFSSKAFSGKILCRTTEIACLDRTSSLAITAGPFSLNSKAIVSIPTPFDIEVFIVETS